MILGNALAAFIDIVITGTICCQLYYRGTGLAKYVYPFAFRLKAVLSCFVATGRGG